MKYPELVKAVNEILSQYTMKLTLRQIYYRLVTKNLIPNTKASYKGLSHQLVIAREKGDVDGSRIEDRSRQVLGLVSVLDVNNESAVQVRGYGDWGFSDPDSCLEAFSGFLRIAYESYQKPMWTNQPKQVIIALEKDALSRLFLQVASEFRVNVYATRGYGSYTFINDLAGTLDKNKEIIILYFGDFDPSGRDIQRDLRERLVRYYGSANFTVIRIALTQEQIGEYNLPPMPEDAETLAKLERDPRTRTYGMEFAVELDALEPPVLQEMIKKAITTQIEQEKWNAKIAEINEEKQELKERLAHLSIGIDGEEF
jgi:hypothetical protein